MEGGNDGVKKASAIIDIKTSFKAKISKIFYMSNTFMKIASYNIKRAKQLETKIYKNKNAKERAIEKHMGYVVGAVFSSVAFLEAAINEVFVRCANNTDIYPDMTDEQKEIMSKFWEINSIRNKKCKQAKKIKEELSDILKNRNNIYQANDNTSKNMEDQIINGWIKAPILLKKYQIALFINNRELYSNNNIYKNVDLVRRLRNSITHYVPGIEKEKDKNMVEELKDINFQLNKLISDKSIYTFFPHKCLSYGCAEWAYQSCIDLVSDFYNRMCIPYYYSNNAFKYKG